MLGQVRGKDLAFLLKLFVLSLFVGPELQDQILVKVITFHFLGLLTFFEM